MALEKALATDFGVDAVYWNIGAVQEDFKGAATEITLYGYTSEAARRENKQPVAATKFILTGENYQAGANRADLYAIIKTTRSEFLDCRDA